MEKDGQDVLDPSQACRTLFGVSFHIHVKQQQQQASQLPATSILVLVNTSTQYDSRLKGK